jgi:hypothetical protein
MNKLNQPQLQDVYVRNSLFMKKKKKKKVLLSERKMKIFNFKVVEYLFFFF